MIGGLSNFDIMKLVMYLKVPNFCGVFLRVTIPDKARDKEYGVVYFNKSSEPGSHWVGYYTDGVEQI